MQCIEYIGELWHCLASIMAQSCPSHLLVIIYFDKAEFLFDDIEKIHASRLCPIYFRLISNMPLEVTVSPIFDMGEGLKEYECHILLLEVF